MTKLSEILEELLFNRFSLLFLGLHWLLVGVAILIRGDFRPISHIVYEPYIVQILVFLNLLVISIAETFSFADKTEEFSMLTYVIMIILSSLQWMLIGSIVRGLFRKKPINK